LPQEVLVAEATPSEPAAPVPTPQPEAASFQSKPTLVAAVATAPEPEDTAKDDSDSMCLQTAQLADWNPFLPCTEVKAFKMVVKAKTIIGAEPPKPAELQPSKPVEVAEVPKTPEPKVAAPKAPEPKPAAKPVVVTPAPAPKSEAVAATGDKPDACMQGATLGDWNPDLPCTADGSSSSLRIEFKD
jgi:hypothetical protein